MKKRSIPAALLLALLLALCACGQGGTEPQDPDPPQEDPAGQTLSWDELSWDGSLELDYAQQFSVDYAGEDFARIDVYLLVSEGMEPPAGVPDEVVVLRQPLQNIYLQATASMDCFRQLDAMDAITLSGTQAEGWYIPEARQAMEEGRILYAGKYSAPDYELLKSQNCDLALESTMIYHTPEVKEQLERIGIPVLVERSSYEVHPLGRMEWIKLYGVLTGKTEEAEAFFDRQLEQLAPVLDPSPCGSPGTTSPRPSTWPAGSTPLAI